MMFLEQRHEGFNLRGDVGVAFAGELPLATTDAPTQLANAIAWDQRYVGQLLEILLQTE